MIKTLLKCLTLAIVLTLTTVTTAQVYQKFPTNVRYIGGGYNNVRPFFKTLEAALNDVKPLATVSNPYVFWLASDSLWVADWDSVFTGSGLTMKDSIDIYYVQTGKIKWMPFGFGGSGEGANIIAQDDVTLHYNWPTWDQTNIALPLWQRQEGAKDDSVDEEIWRLIVYTATPLYIENDTLKIDTTGLGGGSGGWDPDTTTFIRTTGDQSFSGTKTNAGTLRNTGTLDFSVNGNIQLPASNGAAGTARRLWGTGSAGTSNIYYSGSGAAGDTNAVAMVDLSTGLLRNTVVGYGNLTSALIDSIKYLIKPPHASLEFDSIYTPAVTQNVYTKITPGFTEEELYRVTFAGDTATIANNAGGDYKIFVFFAIYDGATSDDFVFQIRINNVAVHTFGATGAGAGTYANVATMHYEEAMSPGDDISLYVTNVANNNDPDMAYVEWYIERNHE